MPYYSTKRRVCIAVALVVLAAAVLILGALVSRSSPRSRADRVTVAGADPTTGASTVEPASRQVTTTEAPATTTSTGPAPTTSTTVRWKAPTPPASHPAPAAVEAQAPAPPVAYHTSLSPDVWDTVHLCEGVAWTATGPTYEGGLGFAPSTWRAYGSSYAANAGYATVAEQKAVAERIMPGGPRWPGRAAGTCSGYHGW